MIVYRAVFSSVGIDMYQVSFKTSKSNPSLNQDFIKNSEPYLTAILISLIPLGVILDILVWRRPHLARFICFFEIIFLVVMMFCPLDFGALHHYAWTVNIIVEYILFGNFDGLSNIMFTIILLLRLLVIGPIISSSYLEVHKIFESFFYTVAVFLGFNIFSMLNFYIM